MTGNMYSGTSPRQKCSQKDIDNIRRIITGEITLEDVPAEERTYPFFLQSLPLRQDILSWYPIPENAKVLEVGAGSGIVTGLLCQRAKNVTALEADGQLCGLNRLRNRDYPGLSVCQGTLEGLPDKGPYDLIFLNDALSRAEEYQGGSQPYQDMLQRVLGMLSEHGRCLVSIANRMGLKYFAGAPEGKSGFYFLGVNQFSYQKGGKTFSKGELSGLFRQAGFSQVRFYYPYPDHFFPQKIFSDQSISTYHYGADANNFEPDRVQLFSESGAAQSAAKEGWISQIANSFLVEAVKGSFPEEDTLFYGKINRDRKAKFQVGTSIFCSPEGGKYVRKYPLDYQAKGHIGHMRDMEDAYRTDKVSCLQGKKAGDVQEYPFLTGKTLLDECLEAAARKDGNAILKKLEDFFTAAFSTKVETDTWDTPEFVEIFGDAALPEKEQGCIYPANIDLISENVFPSGGRYTIIDCEWIMDFKVPAKFILWRNLNLLWNQHREVLDGVFSPQAVYDRHGITKAEEETFRKWDLHFTMEYAGSNCYARYSYVPRKVFLNQLLPESPVKEIEASLYYDTGEGFSESQRILQRIYFDNGGQFRVSFRLPKEAEGQVRALRFDPEEGSFCISGAYLETAGRKIRLAAGNASGREGDKDLFLTTDPVYFVDPSSIEEGEVTVSGSVILLSGRQVSGKIQEVIRRREQEEAVFHQERDELSALARDLENQLRSHCEQIEKQQALLSEKAKELLSLKLEKEEAQKKAAELEEEITAMKNTKGWKMLEKFRRSKNKMKS